MREREFRAVRNGETTSYSVFLVGGVPSSEPDHGAERASSRSCDARSMSPVAYRQIIGVSQRVTLCGVYTRFGVFGRKR